MAHKIANMKGVDPEIQRKLAEAKITTAEQVLAKAGNPAQRSALAKQIGVSPNQITELVNRASLMRLKGLNADMAILLEECGVDSLKDLQQRKASNLQASLRATNDQKKLTHRTPTLAQVQDWINEASSMSSR
jgi:hypothetical protein